MSNSADLKNDLFKMLNESLPSSDSQKMYYDLEHLKKVVNLLLHFKYMLAFVQKNASIEFDYKLKAELSSDHEFCVEQYNQLVDSCLFNDLIRKREEFYDIKLMLNDSTYCSFEQQMYRVDSQSGDTFAAEHLNLTSQQHSQQNVSIVDTIVTEQSHELNLGQQQQNLTTDDYSNNETSESSSFNRAAAPQVLLAENQHIFNLSNLQSGGVATTDDTLGNVTNEATMNLVDESNKLYAGLLDLIPKSGSISSSSSKGTAADDLLDDGQQPSTSGQKRVHPSSNPSSLYKATKYAKADENQFEARQTTTTITTAVDLVLNVEDNESMHVENDLLQVEYWCSFDGCRFKSKSLTQVKAHEERRHVKQIVKCGQDGCGSFFDTKDILNEHMTDTHSGPLFKCALDVCLKEFQSDYRLKQHIREEHKEEYLTCKMCTKKFKTRKYLTRHFRNVHPKEKITDEMASMSSLETKNSTMKCTIDNCDIPFVKRSKLKQHIKEEHKEEYLTCNFCDKVCKTRNNLTNHIWIMHEEGDFKCTFDDCDFVSKFRKSLLNHRKLRHQRERQCPMNECGEMVPITRYQRHMSSLHKIKNYACSWPDCGKSFADHNALKNHVRIHLNFKRYKCKWPECGYASEQRFTVITHIRVCHFKLPRTKKKQLEMNISADSLQNPYDYLEVCREDICI